MRSPSPSAGGTRTCIHTPGAVLTPEELSTQRLDAIVQDAALVYFDGRLTEAALKVARHAKARGVPLLVEGERLRPGLEVGARAGGFFEYLVGELMTLGVRGSGSASGALMRHAGRLGISTSRKLRVCRTPVVWHKTCRSW